MEQRLHKALAAAGVASRRACEQIIEAGRITVNGKRISEQGVKVDPDVDDIRIDGKPIKTHVEKYYLVLNKPTGYVTTVSDKHAEHTVMDLIKGLPTRVYPVGRLDADTAGLLILSNDGAFTEKMTHPSHQVPKTYRVVARGFVPEHAGADLAAGIYLEDGMTAPAKVEWVDYVEEHNTSIIDISIHEGRNRQVRRMFDAIGYPALALTRIQIGPVKLTGIAPGTWRKLNSLEVASLLGSADSTPIAMPTKLKEDEISDPDPVRLEINSRYEIKQSDSNLSTERPKLDRKGPRKQSLSKIDPELQKLALDLAQQLQSIPDDETEDTKPPKRSPERDNTKPQSGPASSQQNASRVLKKIKTNLKKGRS